MLLPCSLKWLDIVMLTSTLKKRRTPNLTFFIQIGSAITFTINNYVKHRILHAMRIVDAISQIKTGETNVDVPIVDVKKKFNSRNYYVR